MSSNPPFTAWEQAVFVALFASFMGGLLAAVLVFVRWLLTWATKREKEWQEDARQRDHEFQEFVTRLRDQGATTRATEQVTTTEEHDSMKSAIAALADAITALTRKFELHETVEFERFDALFKHVGRRRDDKPSP